MTQLIYQNPVCGKQALDLSAPHIMGILNVTPDSFSDGGQFSLIDRALEHARLMVNQGATIIDIGGESTRPEADPVSTEEELARVIPVIQALRKESDVWISLDTSNPQVMAQGIDSGVSLINDVRSLQVGNALEIVAKANIPTCLMHMRGDPKTMLQLTDYDNVIEEVIAFLLQRIEQCLDAGIKKHNILIDPGFGFAKSLAQNYHLLANLERFSALDFPLLIGLSRKGMLFRTLNKTPEQVQVASVTGALLAIQKGANIVRVHDVEATKDALTILQMTEKHRN